MNLRPRPWILLLSVLLTACASAPSHPEDLPSGSETSWACGGSVASTLPSPDEQAALAEDSWACESSEEEPRLTLACSGDACTLFLREDNEPGGIVPARGVNGGTSPSAALRHWAGILIRSPQGKPVFIIPWGHRKPLLPSQKKMLEEARRLAKEPLEKHHIFPRESGLREWFERQGIDIHKETMLLDLETHRRIHLGPNGGPWNQAWRDFQKARPRATKKEMYEHSWELLKRFKLAGFIFPYHDKPPYMLPPPIEY